MAESWDNTRYEFQHTPAPFTSVITGRKLETEPWLATKSSACTSDSHFEKLTNEIKRLSVTRSRRCYLPSLDPSHKPQKVLCAPSPLENSPLTGKKINIHRKNNHETMWWPSEAEPGTTACSFLGYCLPPPAKASPTSCGYKSVWQSEKEPIQDLLASQHIRDCLTMQGNRSAKEPQVCRAVVVPSVTNAHQNNETFYPEPGLAGTVVPGANNKGKRVTCTVSGHEPIRVRVNGEAPILSMFHLFQTELLFDKTPSEELIAEPQLMEVGDSSQDFIQEDFAVASSMNSSEGTAAFYSNLSTGYSTVTNCQRQLLDDIQEQSQDVEDVCSTQSKLSDDANINIEMSCTSVLSEKKDGSVRVGTFSFDKDEDEDRVTDAFSMPEVWLLDREGESEETEISYDASCSKQALRSLTDACSEDLAETLYDANERWEKPVKIHTQLKRPPQTKFTFSKIDVHHIQSENRRNVMHRLTKLPVRCQKRVQTSANTRLQDCKSFPPLFTKSFIQPEKSTHISTINLELDVNVEQNKPQLSLQSPSARMLKWYNPSVNKGVSVPRSHNDSQDTAPPWSRAQFVFVGKGVFNGSECNTPSNSTPKSHHTVAAHNDTNGITNAEADKESRQLKIYVNLRDAAMETHSAFSSEGKPTAVPADLGQPIESPTTHYSHSTNQEDVTDNVSLTVSQHVRGHAEHNDRQVSASKCQDSFSSWDALAHRRCQSASGIQQSGEFNRRKKEDTGHHFSFRSASMTAFSVTSLDDVPYNSPVESPCRNNSPAGDLDYINGIIDGQNGAVSRQTDTINTEEECDRNDYCPKKLDVLPTEIRLRINRNEHKTGQSQYDNVCFETTWTGGDNIMNDTRQRTLQSILKQEHEDDTAVSDSTFDLSPRSHDSVFFDFDDGNGSDKFYSRTELPKKSNKLAGNTATKPQSVTEAGQHMGQTTCDESSMLQQVSQSARDPSQDPKVMLSEGSFLHEYTTTETRGMILTEGVPKNKCNMPVQQDPVGPVYKNVRFADVDKVISFTVPDMTFPVRVNSFNGLPALRTTKLYEGPQNSNPVLHKQTLQLRTYQSATHRQRQSLKRFEFANDVVKFNQRAQETVKSHCLRDLKWSAHSYRNRYPRPSCMFIRGRSLELQADGKKTSGSTADNQCHTSVMYTICQKCEEELHVKFGSPCHVENDNIVLQKVVGNTCLDQEGSGDVRVAGVARMHPAERHGCGHKHDGYCNLCSKIMSWGSSDKKGNKVWRE